MYTAGTFSPFPFDPPKYFYLRLNKDFGYCRLTPKFEARNPQNQAAIDLLLLRIVNAPGNMLSQQCVQALAAGFCSAASYERSI